MLAGTTAPEIEVSEIVAPESVRALLFTLAVIPVEAPLPPKNPLPVMVIVVSAALFPLEGVTVETTGGSLDS